jgi:fibronectin type 3 domain-containing protein
VNFHLRTAESGGNTATNPFQTPGPLSRLCWQASLRVTALAALLLVMGSCGVQAPPQPPRVEIPQEIKDLRAAQIGRTVHITFTLPVLATDSELLDKPVTVSIFRDVSPAGRGPEPPDSRGKPWLTIGPKELPTYTHAGKVDFPLHLSPQEFRGLVGSTFSFSVVAFTRGFRGKPRRSEPSNVARSEMIDVTGPATNLRAKTSQTAVLLTWDKPAETLTGLPPAQLSGYRVYQSMSGKPGSFQLLDKASTNHFADKNFQFGRQYFFRVSAVTTTGGKMAESEPSAPVTITPRDVFPPPVPTGLTVVNAAGAVDLLWNASSGNDLAGYNVYRRAGAGPFDRINKEPAPTPIFHDAKVTPGRHYEYAVTAVDATGNESGKSQPTSITTPSSDSQ